MTETRFVATFARAVQIGPDDWKMDRSSRIFSINCTMRDVLKWLKTLGVTNPNCNDVTFSVYGGEEESE